MIKEFAIATPNKPVNSAIFRRETGCDLYVKDDKFFVSGCATQIEANDLIAQHNPPAELELSVEDKLASVGLNLTDLKSALGL